MKLNPDCVRDVLLAVESCPFEQVLNLETLSASLPDYSENDLCYTCLKLDEGGYLTLVSIDNMRSYRPGIKCIVDLTYQGHEYLNTIRDPKIWSKAKAAAQSLGNFSLKTLGLIAQEIAKASFLNLLSGL